MKGRKGSHGGHGGAGSVVQCLWTLLFIRDGLLCTFIVPAVATLHVGRSSKGLRWAKGRKCILDHRPKLPPCPLWPPCDDSFCFSGSGHKLNRSRWLYLKNREGRKTSHGGHGGAGSVVQCLWTLLFIRDGLLCIFIVPAVATLHVGPVPKKG